jgi:hypothetical protein
MENKHHMNLNFYPVADSHDVAHNNESYPAS